MGRSLGPWLTGRLGYLCYTLALLAALLWLLFPKESVHRLLVRSLNQALPLCTWEVRALELRFPGDVKLRAIEGYGDGGKAPLLRLDTVELRPQFIDSVRHRQLLVGYRAQLARGTIAGTLRLAGDGSRAWIEGTAHGLRLTELALLARSLERHLEGTIGATFAATVDLPSRRVEELKANVQIERGKVELKRAILQHTSLPFSQVNMALHNQGGDLVVKEGKVESHLFSGQFEGEMRVAGLWTVDRLDIRGTLLPRPGFFRGVDNPALLQMLRARLKDHTLPFRISGDPLQPGIHFEEYSVLFESVEKE